MTDVSVTTHVFDAAVDLFEVRDDRTEGHTHPAYANMVGPFGGITAATLLRASNDTRTSSACRCP